ncbi:MAG TPA: ferrous iron transport protein B [Candidatus Marinimicrobia bacterium]|nr:ferrous iron transport protein B [Candidatus Neomarinimicrobiota bacterium]
MNSTLNADTVPWVALVGNPNSGKTAIFNLLTGMDQKVSNYPGVTVEKKLGTGKFNDGTVYHLLDFPGTYSLTPESFDERIVTEQVLQWIHGKNPPAVIVSVVDATNLSRNLYLTTQLLDLGIPIVIALNMMDLVDQTEKLDASSLKKWLCAAAIVPVSALKKSGLNKLQEQVRASILTKPVNNDIFPLEVTKTLETILMPITSLLYTKLGYTPRLAAAQALRLITRNSTLELYNNAIQEGQKINSKTVNELEHLRTVAIKEIEKAELKPSSLEAMLRYQWLDANLAQDRSDHTNQIRKINANEKIDQILTHRWLGPGIFIGLLYFIFQSIFNFASIPMDWIEAGVNWLGKGAVTLVPESNFRGLLIDGIIAGLGAILIFLPQIVILMFFLTLLEDSGYMARVAFMLDRGMSKIGLHGRSVLPLMSGYACAIPGIMSTRTIDNWKERLITMLILPLMSCSARLPVYALMIGAFIPPITVGYIFGLQGLMMVVMYFIGTVTALILAKIFSLWIKSEGKSSFVMEMPPYRMPILRSVFRQVFIRAKLFLFNAGKIIMAISIILWFLASFPKTDNRGEQTTIHNSFAGKIGHAIEPVIQPLGFDWKVGIALITSFAAREVFVSTMATIYNVENAADEMVQLSDAMKNDMNPSTGLPVFTPLVAVSLMVFYVYAAQCMATFAIIRRETNTWKWPLFMIAYMNVLAYLVSLLVYQGGLWLGFS